MRQHLRESPKGKALMTKLWRGLMAAVGLVGMSTALAQTPADPYNYSRTSSFTYDPATGLLKTEKVESGASGVVTTYQYDAYGNKTSATTANDSGASGNALFATRTSSTVYGAQNVMINGVQVATPAGTFATQATNALNQSETHTYDPRFGAPLTLVGPNQLPTSWQVDDFGRTVRETRADGTSTVTAYCFLAGAVSDTSSNSANCPSPSSTEIPANAVSFTHTEPRDTTDTKSGPFVRVYLDAMGRKLRTVTEAFDGATQPGGAGRLIVQDTDYSPQGTVLVSTQPYFLDTGTSTNGGSGYGMSTTEYDALGRATAVYTTDPNGSQAAVAFGSRPAGQAAVTRITYDGLTTTTVNDKGQSRIEEKNVNGKVVRVTDALGAQVAYQYDAFDNLVQTKDALQNTITTIYDIRGRKLSMTDPDTGLWQYDYDALGELVWQQSANQRALGQQTTMRYDVLGRMVQRIDPEYTSNWSFDHYADGSACNMGVGKLCESTTTNGVDRKYFYDNLGRALSNRTDISGGPSFASAVSYDGNTGRPISQTYPTGLTVNLQYTTKGFLSSMTLATAATVNPLPATAGGTPGPGASLPAGSTLWQAVAYNAWGQPEQQTFGNGVVNTATFDALTGRVKTSTAGIGSATTVMNYSYNWDSLSHLTGRTDANGDGNTGAVTDTFVYDEVGRLTNYTVAAPAIPSLQRTVTLQYNALGLLLGKSDVGNYSYPSQGPGVAHPHALQNVAGAFNSSYTYDANGNLKTATDGAYRAISYTSFNLPDADVQGGGLAGPTNAPHYAWQYDENHQRIKETEVTSAGTRTTWMMHPNNVGGLSFEYEQGPLGTFSRHYLTAGGGVIGVLIAPGSPQTLAGGQTAPVASSSITLDKVEYWHKDHLGSLVATTDHTGALTAHYAYDPFGKRRVANGNYDANGNLVYDWNNTNSGTDRGFTGHEHLDDVGVIHMNGRLFDPRLGMFMQGDPFVQDPTNLQNFNRYGYCYNNPMTCTDPSGKLFGIDDMFFYAVIAIWSAEKVGIIDAPQARAFTSIAFTIAMPTPQGILQAAETGFVSGAIATGNVKGAVQGAFSAGMFYGAGNVIQGGNFFTGGKGVAWGVGSAIALHGVVGCVTNVAGGQKCGSGALSAAFTKSIDSTDFMTGVTESGDRLAGALVSAVVGGTGSVLGGGKFSNGAMTGAFSYLDNSLAHSRTPVPFVTDDGQPVLTQSGQPMMRPSDVDPTGVMLVGDGYRLGVLSSPGGIDEINSYSALAFFKIGGPWDWQRVGPDRVFVQEFRDFASVQIGMYAAAANIPMENVLAISDWYASKFSTFRPGTVYNKVYTHLPDLNVYNERLGYDLVKSGKIKITKP